MISSLAHLIDLVPLAAVPLVLVAVFFAASEAGFQYHRRFGKRGSTDDEGQVLSTALLVLALLLGFTFSMALARFDDRRQMVVLEANDIGSAWLRAGLVPAPYGPALQAALADYAQLRTTSPLPEETEKLARAAALRSQLWKLTAQAQSGLDGARASGLISAVTAVFDTGTRREKAVAAHVPGEVVLLLLIFATVACFLLGYMFDAHGDRHRFASGILFLLMGLTVMLILDLDRPAEGSILVDQSAMRELAASLATPGN